MKLFFTSIVFLIIAFTADATVHTITCQNGASHFLPITQNAVVGDTIHWTWVSGNHEVGPILPSDIPSGAAMFNATINTNNHDFEYVVTVAGDYYYVCHPDNPHGEDAYIVVTGSTAIPPHNPVNNLASVYPNPSNGKFQFLLDNKLIADNSEMRIYDLKGQMIYQAVVTNSTSDIDLSNQPNGIYLLEIYSESTILTKKIVIGK